MDNQADLSHYRANRSFYWICRADAEIRTLECLMVCEKRIKMARYTQGRILTDRKNGRKGGLLFRARLKRCDINNYIMHISNIFEEKKKKRFLSEIIFNTAVAGNIQIFLAKYQWSNN